MPSEVVKQPPNKELDLTVARMADSGRAPAGQFQCWADSVTEAITDNGVAEARCDAANSRSGTKA